MNPHPRIDTAAAIGAEIAHHEASYRRALVELAVVLAGCIVTLGPLHVLAWQGIFTLHMVR